MDKLLVFKILKNRRGKVTFQSNKIYRGSGPVIYTPLCSIESRSYPEIQSSNEGSYVYIKGDDKLRGNYFDINGSTILSIFRDIETINNTNIEYGTISDIKNISR